MESTVREAARGRWRGILPAFGIDADALTGKQVPCPLCGGKTRFRFDDKDGAGTWICNRDGAGDGISLVMRVTGMSFADAAKRIEELAGTAPRVVAKQPQNDRQQRDAMNRLWRGSHPVVSGDPVDLWLRGRVGALTVPATLRTCPSCRYHDERPSLHPAMIAMVTDANGRPATLHRTYLTPDGQKADVAEVRKGMPGNIPGGSAVRLAEAGPVLGVAEGIETALAASKLFGLPVWSTLNEVILGKWVAPAGVVEVVVFGDNDASCVGQASAWALAKRLIHSGLRVRVDIPVGLKDWNDVWRHQQGRDTEVRSAA